MELEELTGLFSTVDFRIRAPLEDFNSLNILVITTFMSLTQVLRTGLPLAAQSSRMARCRSQKFYKTIKEKVTTYSVIKKAVDAPDLMIIDGL